LLSEYNEKTATMNNSESKKTHPAVWVPTAYFAEGLPNVAVMIVSVLMYKSMGLADSQIAFFTALASWPWMLKPIWGPLLEMFKTKKHWVVGTQLAGGLAFGVMSFSLQSPNYFEYTIALFAIIAFISATHDIAVDGIYVNVLSDKQQAEYVGWQGACYNIARVLSQGVLVYVAGQLEKSLGVVEAWRIVMGIFSALLLLLSVYHYFVLPSGGTSKTVTTLKETFSGFGEIVRTFFEKEHIWWGIAFLVLYRFAEGQAIKIAPLFLRASRDVGGLGLSTSDVGFFYGIFPPIAFVLGSVLAGYFVARKGLRKSLFTLCCFFNLPFAVYTFLAITLPTNFWIIGAAVTFEYFGYGFGFVGLVLFMMQQIAPGKFKMAHYAFATAIAFFGNMIPSMGSGYLSDFLGYKHFFIYVLIATIPSFLATWFVPFRVTETSEGQQQSS
jgi:PAT family beta-lactamase induction signal transducer AmpG